MKKPGRRGFLTHTVGGYTLSSIPVVPTGAATTRVAVYFSISANARFLLKAESMCRWDPYVSNPSLSVLPNNPVPAQAVLSLHRPHTAVMHIQLLAVWRPVCCPKLLSKKEYPDP